MARKMFIKQFVGTFVLMLHGLMAFAATPQVKNVRAMQRYPWDGKVYISYEVEGNIATDSTSLFVKATDKTTGSSYSAMAGSPCLSGDTNTTVGLHKIVWDMPAQGISINSTNMVFTVTYHDELYLVVDLSAGANASFYPVTYMDVPPSGGFNTYEYKTTKLVLRLITPGLFKMRGSYNVWLSKSFYCGLFEVTQKQYELVTGSKPSRFQGDTLPVERVSWNTIRGDSSTYNWPSSANVDSSSFVGNNSGFRLVRTLSN